MIEIRDDNLAELLTALADGELDAADALAVWDYLVERPNALRWVRDQQQITLTARKTIGSPASSDLRAKIESLVAENASIMPFERATRTNLFRPLAMTSAIAAVLLVGIYTGIHWEKPRPPFAELPPPLASDDSTSPLPVSLVVSAGRIHAECSRFAEALHSASFEKTDAQLAAAVHADLQNDRSVPDLSSIGFHYVGAGPCPPIMQGTVHLLYHSSRPGSIAAISIFVQENHGQFEMNRDTVYAVSSKASPFPMLAWETDRIVYFLVTDNEKIQAAAVQLLRAKTDPRATSLPAK